MSITFDLHPLLRNANGAGKKLGLVLYLVYAFLKVFLIALYFGDYLRHLQSCCPLMHMPYVAECPWEGLGTSGTGVSRVHAPKVGQNFAIWSVSL
jgi:hypothetical protein